MAAVCAFAQAGPVFSQATSGDDGMTSTPCPASEPDPVFPLAEPGKIPTYDPAMVARYMADAKHRTETDWAYLCRYRNANAALAPATRSRIVFMGDSITENWVRYDPAFFGQNNVGRGISGQTSPQMLVRFYQDVIAPRPAVVHIMAGTNDVAGNTGPTSPDAYKAMIVSMVDIAKAHGIAVVIGSIPPTSKFPWKPGLQPAAAIASLNGWLRSYAQANRLIYADYYAAMATPEGGMKAAYTFDGVHPGTEGYRVMRPIAERAIREALAEQRR